MFYIQNKLSGHPLYYITKGKVERCYAFRALAEKDAERIEKSIEYQVNRIDVVEISKSARLYMENQARLSGEK